MKVRSTGLGKTELVAEFTKVERDQGGNNALRLSIESSQPVHWYITISLEPKDIRKMLKSLLKPSVIGFALRSLIARPSPS